MSSQITDECSKLGEEIISRELELLDNERLSRSSTLSILSPISALSSTNCSENQPASDGRQEDPFMDKSLLEGSIDQELTMLDFLSAFDMEDIQESPSSAASVAGAALHQIQKPSSPSLLTSSELESSVWTIPESSFTAVLTPNQYISFAPSSKNSSEYSDRYETEVPSNDENYHHNSSMNWSSVSPERLDLRQALQQFLDMPQSQNDVAKSNFVFPSSSVLAEVDKKSTIDANGKVSKHQQQNALKSGGSASAITSTGLRKAPKQRRKVSSNAGSESNVLQPSSASVFAPFKKHADMPNTCT